MPTDLAGELCRLLADRPSADDGELLARAAAGDHDAFAALVVRHGPMVLGLCRRLLPDAHDAEDAFQATFLVLAQKAPSLRPAPSLAGWLHGVARRVALKARADHLRRRARQRPLPDLPAPVLSPDTELAEVLDEEVARLPAPYRDAVTLCCLGPHTHQQAARQLGCAVGTIKSRLARARRLLHDRLTRRGLAPAVTGLALLAPASAPVPTTLAQAAVHLASHAPPPPGPAAHLARKVIDDMMRKRLAGAVLALTLAGGIGLGLTFVPGRAAPISEEVRADPTRAARDPLPEGALARLGSPRLRHGWSVNALAFSPDGKLLASAGEEYAGGGHGSVRIWEVPSGKEVRSIRGGSGAFQRVALSPDGKLVAWCERKVPGVGVADVLTGRLLARLHQTNPFPTFAFSPDGKTLATAPRNPPAVGDPTLRLWDLATGRETLKADLGHIDRCRFSPDGKLLALLTGGFAGLRLLDVSDRPTRGKFTPFPTVRPAPHAVAFSPDGKLLVGADDNVVRLWNVANGKEERRLPWEGHAAHTVGFSPDGKTVLAVSPDGHVRAWSTATGRPARSFRLPTDEDRPALPPRLALAPNLRWLAAPRGAKAIRLADLTTGKEVPPPPECPANHYTFAYAFSPDGKLMLTPDAEGRPLFWKVRSGRPLHRGDHPTGKIFWAGFDPSGKTAFTLSYPRPTAHLDLAEWDVATGKRLRKVSLGVYPGQVALSPDGKILARGEPNDVRYRSDPKSTVETLLIDVATGKTLRRLDDGKVYSPQALAFSLKGDTFASVGPDGIIRLWEVATGKLLRRMKTNGHAGLHYDLRFTPDGKGLVSLSMTYGPAGHRLSQLVEWDVATGKMRKESDGPTDMGECLGLSPDGKLLAWADDEDGVHVWDVAAGRPRHHFRGLWGGCRFLRFAPDGQTLATGCGDDTILIWDVSAGKERGER